MSTNDNWRDCPDCGRENALRVRCAKPDGSRVMECVFCVPGPVTRALNATPQLPAPAIEDMLA